MTARAEVILADARGREPLGHPRTPHMRFEEAARIASSLNAAADTAVQTLLTVNPRVAPL
jgi:hypothetical protein